MTDRPRLTLRKPEKLRHKKLVNPLFLEGKSWYEFPLRMVWKTYESAELEAAFRNGLPPALGPMQMLITVPKKKRRHAVDRVLLRRRIREAYRLHRLSLAETVADNDNVALLSMGFVYMASENIPYRKIEKSMISLLTRLKNQLSSSDETPGNS